MIGVWVLLDQHQADLAVTGSELFATNKILEIARNADAAHTCITWYARHLANIGSQALRERAALMEKKLLTGHDPAASSCQEIRGLKGRGGGGNCGRQATGRPALHWEGHGKGLGHFLGQGCLRSYRCYAQP